MQADLELLPLAAAAEIAGVNAAGHESGNVLMRSGRLLPWLQDDGTPDTGALCECDLRDVVVLAPDNRVTSVYNLTSNDLADPVHYEELKALIVEAAGSP